ncbi:protein kinase family protein [Aspergillus ibericus CBS 121593]|uniref:Kinase-like protein n=1 Tax=Aspergillus ibericus CBS 121593 TaxID=1448316 RepID=A0A395GUT6_9EURO|nr:kinase-like protein [Aspergillus ibericus CBS 121593]RAK99236.1 kinase-like protein [Aspergillus ibericus CBS 121593]
MAISIADSSCSPTRSLGLLLDPEKADLPRPKQSMWHRLGLRKWLGREDRDFSSHSPAGDAAPTANKPSSPAAHNNHNGNQNPGGQTDNHKPHARLSKPHDLTRRLSRKVGVGLPRAPTFKRQNSERRDNLLPPEPEPRRAVSADRRRAVSSQRSRSPPPTVDPRLSAPEVQWREAPSETTVERLPEANEDSDFHSEWNPCPDVAEAPEELPDDTLEMELEKRWILNLSMHFRDRSEREKFFVTYAETPTRWRRVTISCDYRGAPPDSLEQDLRELRYQRDKCARIYESIRESLSEIQFYDTVTNLKLETRDGRLHVHVTEDVNEIIPYPPVSCIGHLPQARLIPENQLHFEAHLSGFVYNVNLEGKSYIKKEIPGPDTVDEFLYEINALHALQGTPYVVQVEGIVVDDQEQVVKGLLIGFAEKGALVDILYENRGTIAWERRERWARQIVHGLCEIHEAGYVQGDFTLSNIVVDADDNAKIIDINRRGCPVGWEPPEIAAKIESNQRISMYIGVKTDLFQLGMTLWALAMEEDEPERQPRPLMLDEDARVPDYYRRLVSICLSPSPRHRLSAKELLGIFPRSMWTTEPSFPRIHPAHTGLGVALQNGALPPYDPRAAFLYQHTRPVANGGSFDTQLSLDDAYSLPQDDSDLVSSPDREQFDPPKEQQTRTIERDLLEIEPSAEQQRRIPSVNGLPLQPTLRSAQELRHCVFSSPKEDELDLDPSVNAFYRRASVDRATGQIRLPGELPGGGDQYASSLNRHSRSNLSDNGRYQESPLSSAATQSTDLYPAHLGDLGHALIDDEHWSEEPSRSVSSLLHSILPINPASNLSEQKLIDSDADRFSHLNIRSALRYPRQGLQEPTAYLSDSHLPINPAFTETALAPI